jgi:hypothetical protein
METPQGALEGRPVGRRLERNAVDVKPVRFVKQGELAEYAVDDVDLVEAVHRRDVASVSDTIYWTTTFPRMPSAICGMQ